MENLPATRSILKPSRSSHSHSRSQSSSRKPAVTIAEPATPQRGAPGKPAQDFTVTFPNVHSARQLEELAFDFARRIQSRRLDDENNGKGKAKEIAMAPPLLKAGRPTHRSDDYPEFRDVLTGPWHSGAHYAPVFKPFIATKLSSLQINPHIASMSPVLIRWDVTQPAPNDVEFQDEPLTAPRVTELNVVSKSIPWPLKLKESPFLRAGVTVADFLSMLSLVMRAPLRDVDLDALTEEERNAFLTLYRRRCPEGDDPHRVYDLLLGSTLFGGLAYDEGNANEQSRAYWDIHLRATFLPKEL